MNVRPLAAAVVHRTRVEKEQEESLEPLTEEKVVPAVQVVLSQIQHIRLHAVIYAKTFLLFLKK